MKIENIPIDRLYVSNLNIRHDHEFGDEEDKEFIENVESLGLLQPIVVRKQNDDTYEILIGRRRYLSLKDNGATEIPCVIKELDDLEALDASISENLFRKNVDPVTMGKWIKRRLEMSNLSLNQYARKIGKSKSTLSEWIRMNDLSTEVQSEVQNGAIPFNYALKVARLDLSREEEESLAEISHEQGFEKFKEAVDELKIRKETRGSPKGLKILRINFGSESREHDVLRKMAESNNMKLSDFCLNILKDYINSTNP